jgi:hypothetical protein
MIGKGECDASGAGEEAGVVVGGTAFAVPDQVPVARVGCRVDLHPLVPARPGWPPEA